MHDLLGGFEFIMRGGFMMYPLLLSGLVAITVILERFYIFTRAYSTPEDLASKVLALVQSNQLKEAEQLCQGCESPVAAVLAAGIGHFSNPVEEMELSMKNQAEQWIPLLEKRIEVIDTVITAAPLMGLLGTITGMMASFRVLSEKGVNEPNAITGGVAEALIATATGLVIALLCLVAYNYLSSRVRGFIYQVEGVASRLIEARMAADRGGNGSNTENRGASPKRV
jgi:biopolymer transport protein ExbB